MRRLHATPDPAPRVLIVDDSAVARAVLARFVTASGRYAIAAAVADADAALAFLARERVDVVLLDLELPRTSGIEALPALLAAGQGARVLVVSGSAAEGAAVTMRALALGAADTLVKPAANAFASRFGDVLIARLDLLTAPGADARAPAARPRAPAATFDVIAIGASTGGIHALAGLLGAIPATLTQPILITQHLPASFSPFFAAQVALSARRPCEVAQDRVRVRPGHVLVAPGDSHMVTVSLGEGTAATRLSREPSPTGNLPSVDPMFASLAAAYGPRVLAIVLSGMGRDGLEGARAVRAAGGTVVVQDAESSVVWGMPGAVAAAGLANAVLSPAEIGAWAGTAA
ncbi:chemotaxis protein CheB [Sphingomonas corticis]|jgi:two-component system chemotaxis response regulator CheB|uniref:protein-glutamate methylesterase n=1 Tax=Sphingomonas corticis TaxID=2722791 RepID=A0ABX1CSS2_9SPHN|nr:chemotaxis protein CheB [Sphingomonas corticis]NJR79462.1 response regulator [Sphingomonas corticis]